MLAFVDMGAQLDPKLYSEGLLLLLLLVSTAVAVCLRQGVMALIRSLHGWKRLHGPRVVPTGVCCCLLSSPLEPDHSNWKS